jgi:hypothetical protein
MILRPLLSFVVLQAGWFACVLGAARGYPWLGPAVVAVVLARHVAVQPSARSEALVLGTAAAVGFLVDTVLLRFHILHVVGATLSPPWLVALWPNFISTTADDGMLRALPRRPLLASALGAIGGPVAYDAGARLGAVELGPDRVLALVVIGLVWAVTVPALATIRRRVERRRHSFAG